MKKLFFLLIASILMMNCSTDKDENLFCSDNFILETFNANSVTSSSAILNGYVKYPTCNEVNVTSQGFVYSDKRFPEISDNIIEVSGNEMSIIIENLDPNKEYYYRSFISSNNDIFYGNERHFNTELGDISVTWVNGGVTNILSNTAKFNAEVCHGGLGIELSGFYLTSNPNTHYGLIVQSSVNIQYECNDMTRWATYDSGMGMLSGETTYYVTPFIIAGTSSQEFIGQTVEFTTLPD